MAHFVQTSQMTNCCGVYFMNNFFANDPPLTIEAWGSTEKQRKLNYPGLNIDQNYVDKQNKDTGRESTEQYRDRIRRSLEQQINMYKLKKSYLLAILNEIEAKQIEDIFLDVGFEILVPMTKNPTGSAIVTYIYHLLPRPIEKKEVKSVIPRKAA